MGTIPKQKFFKKGIVLIALMGLLLLGVLFFVFHKKERALQGNIPLVQTAVQAESTATSAAITLPSLDVVAYEKKLVNIANVVQSASSSTSTAPTLWPVKTAYPNAGALLPFNRVVAYYGNFYSKHMGILGQYPETEVAARLEEEVHAWQAADPSTPVIPAIHYIAVVAQAGTGRDGKYRLRMPDGEIGKAMQLAAKMNGLVFLDIQVGLSTVRTELPELEKYFKLPNVHAGIDPEFSMKNSARPGTEIGTLDAEDINFAAGYLAKIVQDNNLPPKILVIHRFTEDMVTNYKKITPLPEVQLVMNMDGFGGAAKKLNTYKQFIAKEPVQFTGFKLFYSNDVARGDALLTPRQLLRLSPIPIYVQYQ